MRNTKKKIVFHKIAKYKGKKQFENKKISLVINDYEIISNVMTFKEIRKHKIIDEDEV